MRSHRIGRVITGCAVAWAFSASTSLAQSVPWVLFQDSLTFSACDVVNAENAELVVLIATGELVLVTGSDKIVDGTFVDIDAPGPPWFVFFFGEPAGVVDFAVDGDGFSTLWWLSPTLLPFADPLVIHVNTFTGQPTATDLFPTDFVDVPCDATPFWDGCLSDSECDDGDECTLDICDAGVCDNAPIFGCDDDRADGPVITINFCGTSTGMSLALTAIGLGLTCLTRRR